MRLGFIMVSIACNKLNLVAFLVCENEFIFGLQTHCRGNLKFDFHKHMLWVSESHFKKVVGIR